MVVLVTGALGQLGQAIQHLAPKFGSLEFVYTDYADADITNAGSLQALFQKVKPAFCNLSGRTQRLLSTSSVSVRIKIAPNSRSGRGTGNPTALFSLLRTVFIR